MAAHPVRDGICQLSQLRGRRRAGAVQTPFALRLLDVRKLEICHGTNIDLQPSGQMAGQPF